VKRLKGNKTKKQLIADFKQLLEGVTIVEEKDVKKANASKAREIVADVDIKRLSLHRTTFRDKT